MVPVVIVNPSSPRHMKHRRRSRRRSHHRKHSTRRHRRNPSIPFKGLALAGLGGAVIGGISYALGMTELGEAARAGITAASGAVLGGVTAMASPMAGAGIAGAGVGIATKEAIAIGMAPKAAENTKTKTMGRVVSAEQLEAVVDRRVAAMLGARNANPTMDLRQRQRAA